MEWGHNELLSVPPVYPAFGCKYGCSEKAAVFLPIVAFNNIMYIWHFKACCVLDFLMWFFTFEAKERKVWVWFSIMSAFHHLFILLYSSMTTESITFPDEDLEMWLKVMVKLWHIPWLHFLFVRKQKLLRSWHVNLDTSV